MKTIAAIILLITPMFIISCGDTELGVQTYANYEFVNNTDSDVFNVQGQTLQNGNAKVAISVLSDTNEFDLIITQTIEDTDSEITLTKNTDSIKDSCTNDGVCTFNDEIEYNFVTNFRGKFLTTIEFYDVDDSEMETVLATIKYIAPATNNNGSTARNHTGGGAGVPPGRANTNAY